MIQNMSMLDLKKYLATNPKSTIIDVRTQAEIANGKIENALEIDFLDSQLFLETVKTLDKTHEYIIYCRSGNRSLMACQLMAELGFLNLININQGYSVWEKI